MILSRITTKFVVLLAAAFACGIVPYTSSLAGAEGYSWHSKSRISVEIKLEKEIYRQGEDLEGIVEVHNGYPATVPVVFYITLYRNDREVSTQTTSISALPTGKMTFSFKRFGVPDFNRGPDSVGVWRIKITTAGQSSFESTATIRIVSSHPTS